MEDILDLNLPEAHTIQRLQSVRLHLRITIKSEITDHIGTHIPLMLQAPTRNQPPPSSIISFEQEHPPVTLSSTPSAWKRWRKLLTWLYFVPDTYQLQQLFDLWLPDYNLNYQWEWQICPCTVILFQYHWSMAHLFPILTHHHNYLDYCYQANPIMIPHCTIPAVPILLLTKIQVSLPIPGTTKPVLADPPPGPMGKPPMV